MNLLKWLMAASISAAVESASINYKKAAETSLNDNTSDAGDSRERRSTSLRTSFNKFAAYVLAQQQQALRSSGNEAMLSEQTNNRTTRRVLPVVSGSKSPSSTFFLNFFPAEVHVTVESSQRTESISLALAPDMSVYDAVRDADVTYSSRNNDIMISPFSTTVRLWGRCAVIDSLEGADGEWNVQVTDGNNQVIHNARCIPRRSQITLRPGYSVIISPMQSSTL